MCSQAFRNDAEVVHQSTPTARQITKIKSNDAWGYWFKTMFTKCQEYCDLSKNNGTFWIILGQTKATRDYIDDLQRWRRIAKGNGIYPTVVNGRVETRNTLACTTTKFRRVDKIWLRQYFCFHHEGEFGKWWMGSLENEGVHYGVGLQVE